MSGLRIGLDAWRAVSRPTGMGHYALNLVRSLLCLSSHDFLVATKTQPPEGLFGGNGNLREHVLPGRALAWDLLRLPWSLRRERLDLFHFTSTYLPPVRPFRAVVTVHDLAFERFPETFTAKDRTILGSLVPRAARGADRVIAVSESTKRDLVDLYRISEEKIAVVPHGVSARFRPGGSAETVKRTLARHSIRTPYLLCVGTLQPRKNLTRLFEAFSLAVKRHELPHQLVVVGARGWLVEQALRAGGALGDRLCLCGYVADEEVVHLYQGADVFVMPSLYEGFGLPLLEAMACGTPSLASNSSSLPEVGGEAVRYFDGRSVEHMAELIAEVLADAGLRDRLARAGLERAAGFSWERTAESTLTVYEEVAAE